jgi:hypothetical protein
LSRRRSPRAIIVVDNAPLQKEAWAEYHEARGRHDRAARDLHRHEQVDVPEYERWLHRTFPIEISTLRNLHEEVAAKSRQVDSVRFLSGVTGRSPRKLWQEQKAREANPQAFPPEFDPFSDEEFDEAEDGSYENDANRRGPREDTSAGGPDLFERAFVPKIPDALSREAKAIYRRLVQFLHPDRGGAFTAVRKRLWHEVQQAWAERDSDWLARLEVEWENANDVLGPDSPVGRLRRAVRELHSARRDTEKKLRQYRKSPSWRFSLNSQKRDKLHSKTAMDFEHDIALLQRRLDYLLFTIKGWERRRRRRTG